MARLSPKAFAIMMSKKERAAKAQAPAAEQTPASPKVRTPAIVSLTVESVETRNGPKAGEFAYTRVGYTDKAGKAHSNIVAMAFGDVYASLKDHLVAGATLKVQAHFNSKKNVGSTINIVGLAA